MATVRKAKSCLDLYISKQARIQKRNAVVSPSVQTDTENETKSTPGLQPVSVDEQRAVARYLTEYFEEQGLREKFGDGKVLFSKLKFEIMRCLL